MSVERRGTKALEIWAKRATDGYAGVSISNMTTAWRNGLAFCALIHHFRPDLIEYSSLKPENILENNALAFRVAEQQLGIPALLDAEDMVECDIPDRLSVLTYVSQFYQVFSSLGLTSPKRVVNKSSPPSSPAGVKTKLTPPPPQPKTKTEIKTDKVLVGGRSRREVCAGCSNPVFLAERLLVGSPGQLMHRTCFRCARCTTQLTLASYYETEKGQFCCETCPDEELNIVPEDTNSIISSTTSPKLSRRTSTSDSDSEYDSEGSENESDGYSNNVELVLEDKTQNDDTRSDTLTHSPKVTPGPPKPRTVFLSKTLEGENKESSSNEHKETIVVEEKKEFSQVSPALFGPREKDARATKASDSGVDHCDDAKGLITDPPDKLTLDTGQGNSSDNISNSANDSSSSIVAQRLKMFREISDKTSSTYKIKSNVVVNKTSSKKDNLPLNVVVNKPDGKEKNLPLNVVVNKTDGKENNLLLNVVVNKPDGKENNLPLNVVNKTDSKVSNLPLNVAVKKDSKVSNLPLDVAVNETDSKENNLSLQNSEKYSNLQLKVSEKSVDTNREDSKQAVKDENKDQVKVTIDDPDKDENTKDLRVERILHKDEIDSSPYEITSEKDSVEITEKKSDSASPIPSITISSEKEGDKDTPKETEGTEDSNEYDTGNEVIRKLQSSKEFDDEYNPFDDEDESQLEESGVAVTQSQGGSDLDNNATSVSQDSGAEFSSASLRSIQYPGDLNPFGSEGEDEMEGAVSISKPVSTETSKSDEVPAKKLIKANLNPFESDEDEVFVAENKSKDNVEAESKNLNPFWSDDEEPLDSANSTPSKSKIKPPRPPPPTLARNITPSHMYGKKEASTSPHGTVTERKKIVAPTPPPARELFPQQRTSPLSNQTRVSPSLPTAKIHPSPSSPSGSVALRRKGRRAPAPPQAFTGTPKSDRVSSGESTADTTSMDTMSLSSLGTQSQATQEGQEDEGQDEVMSWKMQKDMKNHSNKMNGTTEHRGPPPKPVRVLQASKNLACSTGLVRRPSMSKSECGEWQRKKGPAPPRPVPQKRAIRKMPMRLVQQELHDIEIKQTELERQGVLLETSIRKRTESTSNNPQEDAATIASGPSSIEVEDMIMQLFELVNEKNELFRRQTELMYLKREKRLEEEHVEIEYQIRCLMLKPPSEKTEIDTAQEEELIARLVKVVEQRDEIINCLELDRLREAQEDESIATHMMQYQEKHIDGIENGCSIQNSPKKKKTLKLPKKKKKKEKKDKKGAKADADKDIDETEVKETKKRKKKWLF